MTTNMTNNPYFSPITMQDGSTRRPIVERDPECLPIVREHFDLALSVLFPEVVLSRTETGMVFRGRKHQDFASVCSEDVALALCRCSIEDWLCYRTPDVHIADSGSKSVDNPFVHIFVPSPLPGGGVKVDYSKEAEVFAGKTIHDALNAAAHAVADALGIAP